MNFRKSYIKLTVGYLCLILLVSGILSFVLYGVAIAPFERRLEMGERILEGDFGEPPPPDFRPRFEPLAVNEAKRGITIFLIYLNIGVLCLAGVLSYGLARRELKPMEAALDLQSRFTSDAAHELRTPLTAMKTEIEVALRGGEIIPGETRELLESNLEEIDKLEALSGSLLKLAQYEGGMEKGEMSTVRLGAVVEEAVERVRRSADARGIGITFGIEEGEAAVVGDKVSLVEMLVILLDNSIKYSDAGTSINILTQQEKHHLLIQVLDQGYGIGEQDLEHVFDRFYRGKIPASKGQIEGYGLGLSIAKRIAELHRGSIAIESVTDGGTEVTVRLPLAREKKDHATVRPPSEINPG